MANRIEYIDALRGFTMTLVVLFNLGGPIPPPDNQIVINGILELIRMPLFFFISGFLMFSDRYTNDLLKSRTRNRLLRQLYPTFLIGGLYCITCTDLSLVEMWYSFNKGGYWFTFVSVELFFLFAPLVYLMGRTTMTSSIKVLSFLCLGFLFFCINQIAVKKGITYTDSWKFFNLYHLTYYSLFFLSGAICKMMYHHIQMIVGSISFLITMACLFAVSYLLIDSPYSRMISCTLTSMFFGISFFISLFSILFSKTTFSSTKAANLLGIIGRSTLEIYLLHYFVLSALFNKNLKPYFEIMSDSWYYIPCILLLTFAVISICLTIVKTLKHLRVYSYVFPSTVSNKAYAK